MKFLDEYRDYDVVQRMALKISRVTTRPWTIMEVCGGQTYTIVKSGLQELLPPLITLVHGPGCPVCVTPVAMIDRAVATALLPQVVLCSFGDMLRVPGSSQSLLDAKSLGADVRIVYSPLDALQLARSNPGREVVFFAVGFETTAPANAMADPGIQESLGHLRLAGKAPLELIIIGVVPKSSNLGDEISAPVMYRSSIAVDAIARLLMERGVACARRHVTLPLNLWWLPDRGHDYAASSALNAHH